MALTGAMGPAAREAIVTKENGGEFGSEAYVRRLKRYEAAPYICARDQQDGAVPMDFYSPFGPMIAKTRIGASLLDKLNRFAEQAIARQQNSGGPPLGELSLPGELVSDGGQDSLAGVSARCIERYLAKADDREPAKIRFENFWMVRHFSGTASPVHFHSGDMSGVLYLKMPDRIANQAREERQTYINSRRAAYITFLIGGKQRFSKSLISFKPEVGDFYVFPGWLLHVVEPFLGEGERRSLSFNAFVD